VRTGEAAIVPLLNDGQTGDDTIPLAILHQSEFIVLEVHETPSCRGMQRSPYVSTAPAPPRNILAILSRIIEPWR
jgi:hypothetical protein